MATREKCFIKTDPASFFFYDLETSGLYPDSSRIMQFAGQRTDSSLNPIGDPVNVLITLPPDVLPDPAAVLVHGVSPLQTRLEGMTEAEFMHFFKDEIARPHTVFVGYNNVRFDDEFIRYLHYRNLYDPYSWSYEDGRSRWDLLDVVRLTRALRPDGIEWPTDPTGAPTNRLELLTKANGLVHEKAHDALSDVMATIAVGRLILTVQPKLFAFLLNLKSKQAASELVMSGKPFVYTTSHYPSSQLHTSVVVKIGQHPDSGSALIYDLRHDPTPWLQLGAQQIADAWRYDPNKPRPSQPLPLKTMKLNRCPAIAPLSVIDRPTEQRLGLSLEQVNANFEKLSQASGFAQAAAKAVALLNEERNQQRQLPRSVEQRLYDGFFDSSDRQLMQQLHLEEKPELFREQRNQFHDRRLQSLVSLYLARNYPAALSQSERNDWEEYLKRRLIEGGSSSMLARFFARIEQLATERTDSRSQSLLEDLKLYGESLIPSDLLAG